MSGTQLFLLVAVGALAVVALAGVAILLAQVHALRRELAEARRADAAEQALADGVPDAAPNAEPHPGPGPAGEPSADNLPVRALRDQQIVLATLGHPLVRVAAVAHGVQRALRPENRDRITALMQRDLRRREKLRRREARRAARALDTRSSEVEPAGPTAPSEVRQRAARPPQRRDLAS